VSGRVAGKCAIVTGATSGIGEAVAQRFAAEGARLVLVSRREELGRSLVARLPAGRALFLAGDVTDPGTATRATEAAVAEYGRCDILVNNAAMDYSGDLLDASRDEVVRVFDVNFFGPLALLQAVASHMKVAGGGSIVNVVSRTASVGVATMAVYGASKGALLALTRAAAVELAPFAIRVNAVAPGLTDTPLVRAWLDAAPDPANLERAAEAEIPQGRFAIPDEVASAILYLASNEASHVTGVSLPVDGGYTAQ
jgi:NAD(P)-dependent dehydrogenase (short-subunit alcohol dehydrogenase family)